ncbi:MAG: DUF3108 domain-containing protein [Bacteroidetes bacterium]|nr:DUF3108 domain-containing protein [Bacteroidota bacterium]
MKKSLFVILPLLAIGGLTLAFRTRPDAEPAPAPKVYPKYKVSAFQPGERIVYRVHYGTVTAGDVTFSIDNQLHTYNGRQCYRFQVNGSSSASFDLFYKYRAAFDTYVDSEALFPWHYTRSTDEGSYHFEDRVYFDHQNNVIKGVKGTFQMPDNTQDMISVFYYARSLAFEKMTPGKIYKMPATFLDDKIFPGAFRYYGTEVIKTPLGRMKTHKVSPVLDDGSVFKGEEEMKIWISADANKIPVRITSPVIVGNVAADLKEYSGLRNPFAAIVE